MPPPTRCAKIASLGTPKHRGAIKQGVIALRDHEWFEGPSRQDDLDEVDPWRPRGAKLPHEAAKELLLRTGVHRLFGTGHLTVMPDGWRFQAESRLKVDLEKRRRTG